MISEYCVTNYLHDEIENSHIVFTSDQIDFLDDILQEFQDRFNDINESVKDLENVANIALRNFNGTMTAIYALAANCIGETDFDRLSLLKKFMLYVRDLVVYALEMRNKCTQDQEEIVENYELDAFKNRSKFYFS